MVGMKFSIQMMLRDKCLIFKKIPISEIVRISEVTLKITPKYVIIQLCQFSRLKFLNMCNEWCKLFTPSIQVNIGVNMQINEGLLY